jgi:hypothetical protein
MKWAEEDVSNKKIANSSKEKKNRNLISPHCYSKTINIKKAHCVGTLRVMKKLQ